MFEAINEEYFVELLTCPSMFLYNQSEFTFFTKFFVKRAAVESCSAFIKVQFASIYFASPREGRFM